MRKPSFTLATQFLVPLLSAAALTACGGGGGDGSASTLSTDAATTDAANSSLMSSSAASAFDGGVQASQSIMATAAASSTGGTATAMSATGPESVAPDALGNIPVSCPGGGSAVLTVTAPNGATPVQNGQFVTGQVYQIVYTNCLGAAGVASLNGTLTLTAVNATATDLSLTLATGQDGLSVTLPNGTVTLSGNTARDVSTTTGPNGAIVATSHFTSPNVTLATQFNHRQSTFTLSAVDITRTTTTLNGVLQSSSINGTHTLSATLPNNTFTYTVSTQGGVVTYGPDGVPTSGSWTITLPNTIVTVTINNGVATISIDDGKDGTINRTITVTIPTLQTDAG